MIQAFDFLSHLDRFSFGGVTVGGATAARRVVLDHILSHLALFSFDFASYVVHVGVKPWQPPDGDVLACAGGQSPSIRTPAHAVACLASAWDGTKQLELR